MIVALAGPVVGACHRARVNEDEGWYSWRDSLLDDAHSRAEIDNDVIKPYALYQACGTDVTKAYAFAEALYPRSPWRADRAMDAAVSEIEARLNSEPGYWRTIDAVAEAVLARKRLRLTHDPAVQIMRKA